jgi:formamidopyrimidine-DNA glycosylase
MPELPEVETTVRGLASILDGQAISAWPCAAPICAARSRQTWPRR